jgi:triacylglycerol esterase/lipase EstA (alpha/beta hydrolase family)
MAARWSATLLLLQLLAAAGLATVLVAVFALSGLGAALCAVLELCAVALLLAAAPLALARRAARGSLMPACGADLLRALCGDAVALQIAMARMMLEPCRAAREAGAASKVARPVMLVHGFGCSRAVWRPLLARLRAAGVGPVRAVSLEPMLEDIESYATQLLGELERLASRGGNQVTVIAHSMGGLVARAALRRARAGLIGRIVTIGAPHHGTALACRFSWKNARQMCTGSSWLAALNEGQEGRLPVPMTTLYSLEDNYIIPADSAVLAGARAVELRGVGHLGLLDSTTVLDRVMAELLQ